jgi:hypothetical protein
MVRQRSQAHSADNQENHHAKNNFGAPDGQTLHAKHEESPHWEIALKARARRKGIKIMRGGRRQFADTHDRKATALKGKNPVYAPECGISF